MYPVIDSKEASSWVFPTNMSVRKYQVDICRTALENNTLVCLPTGLGKTLIAAVLVYNFYRFFPDGKIVFMAPTKPLVAQQFKACSDIMRLPENDVILLEGSVSPSKRELKWKEARVFFITPQTLANDLESGVVSPATARKFVLVVADEAHRATDGYAYTHIVQHFTKCNNKFRVLALSATPGSDLRAVQTVIYNLNIARIEIRSEEDPGVAEFTHLKQVELITCSDTTALKFRRRNSHYFSEDTDDDADPYAGVDLFHDVPSSLKGRGKGSIPRGGPVVSPNSAQDSTIINHLTALMGPPVSFLASHSVLMSDNPGAVTSFIVQDAERNVAQKLRDLFDPNRVVNVNANANANANTAQSRAIQQERTLRASLSSALSVLTFLVKCKNSYLGVHGGVRARSAPSLRVMLEDMQVETESSLSGGAVAGAEGEQCLEVS
jgi:superfamily II DNA or RNA helicase